MSGPKSVLAAVAILSLTMIGSAAAVPVDHLAGAAKASTEIQQVRWGWRGAGWGWRGGGWDGAGQSTASPVRDGAGEGAVGDGGIAGDGTGQSTASPVRDGDGEAPVGDGGTGGAGVGRSTASPVHAGYGEAPVGDGGTAGDGAGRSTASLVHAGAGEEAAGMARGRLGMAARMAPLVTRRADYVNARATTGIKRLSTLNRISSKAASLPSRRPAAWL